MADEQYAIAIVGGATAGAEAADAFAKHGFLTVVFDQNPRPYGKVEDGLPKWHVALRAKEYKIIDKKLCQEHVHFLPCTALGRDFQLRDLVENWGFHSVVLANGAWRDRRLPIEDADKYIGRGLVYQNPFIMWFNHRHEARYEGERFESIDGTAVVGGGLASIDVAKVFTMELTLARLAERGIESDLVELEIKGIPKILAGHGLKWEDLGIEGSTIYYRRRREDMPLVSMPESANEKVQEKIQKSRLRTLDKAMAKYLFKIETLLAPVELIVEDDWLVGLEFAKTIVEGGRVKLTDERVEIRAPQFISSIGSIPQPIEGIPMRGELYDYQDWDIGSLEPFPTLFSVGNVVTGKGNIVDSRRHAKKVAAYVANDYFQIAEEVKKLEPLDDKAREALLKRIGARQQKLDYVDYESWISASKPPEFL